MTPLSLRTSFRELFHSIVAWIYGEHELTLELQGQVRSHRNDGVGGADWEWIDPSRLIIPESQNSYFQLRESEFAITVRRQPERLFGIYCEFVGKVGLLNGRYYVVGRFRLADFIRILMGVLLGAAVFIFLGSSIYMASCAILKNCVISDNATYTYSFFSLIALLAIVFSKGMSTINIVFGARIRNGVLELLKEARISNETQV